MVRKACEYRADAREMLRDNWGNAVVFTLVVDLIASVVSLIPEVGSIIALFLIPMNWSYTVAFLDVKRNGGKYETGRLFEGYNDFGRIFGTHLLEGVYILLWSLLLIVPGIIKSFSYAMTAYILRDDKELSYNAAIEKSMAMMEGHKLEWFYLNLSFIGWILLTILTLGIGGLWVQPYISASYAQFYEDVKAEYEAKNTVV